MTAEPTELRDLAGPAEAPEASAIFARALRGHPCHVVVPGADPAPLPMADWTRDADAADLELLSHCEGATLDVGCGPGRLAERLALSGHDVLGVDVVPEAVHQTRERGVPAVLRDVFEPLPGEGRWRTALLADGNVGIGGDPVALLVRVRELLVPGGRVVVELAGPDRGHRTMWAELHCGETRSRPFRWSVVGVDAITDLAAAAGLRVHGTHGFHGRWCAVLEVPDAGAPDVEVPDVEVPA